jgi:hypothetical protein
MDQRIIVMKIQLGRPARLGQPRGGIMASRKYKDGLVENAAGLVGSRLTVRIASTHDFAMFQEIGSGNSKISEDPKIGVIVLRRLRDVIGLEIGDGTAQIMKLIARESTGRVAVQYGSDSER